MISGAIDVKIVVWSGDYVHNISQSLVNVVSRFGLLQDYTPQLWLYPCTGFSTLYVVILPYLSQMRPIL